MYKEDLSLNNLQRLIDFKSTNNTQHFSVSTTIIPPTTVGTLHSLNCFGHVICFKRACTSKILQNF